MKIGNSTSAANSTTFQIQLDSNNGSYSKNLHNQIENAQKSLQELSDNKEMSVDEKMKKRQEIQKQITELQQNLRQHQIEQRRSQRENKGSSIDDMISASPRGSKNKKGTGVSAATMQSMVSADMSIKQVEAQGLTKAQMEGTAGILKTEIEQDAARGIDTSRKEEELEDINKRSQNIASAQIGELSKANESIKDAKESENDADNTIKGNADNSDNNEVADINAISENSISDSSNPIGNNVDVKL